MPPTEKSPTTLAIAARRAGKPAAAALFLAGVALSGHAAGPDPFATEGLAAASQAGSVRQALPPAPCARLSAAPAILVLADVVEQALCNNPQTREAWANARYQAAQLGIARSAYLPTLDLSASDALNRANGSATTAFGASSYNQRTFGASLNYLIYDFGARDAALQNAKELLAALNATQDATIQTVFLSAVQAYFQLFAARAAVDSALEAEKAALESLNAATARYQVGSATPADRLQAQTAHSQAVLTRIQAQGDALIAQGVLANAMGADADRVFQLVPPTLRLPDTKFDADIAKLIAEARQRRPDLAAAQAQVEAARANVTAARAAGMPSIALGATATRSESNISDPADTASLGVTVSYPLFTGYNNTYRVRAAQAQVDIQLAEHQRIGRQVALDVWKAYQALVTGSQAVQTSADLVASASLSEQVALGRYKAGAGNILDLLTAQSALAGARLQNIQAVYNWHIAKASLAQSMGSLDFSTIGAPQAGQPTIQATD